MFLIQVREDGLPGLLDPAPRLVGMGLEEAPGNAPLLATLNAALGTTPQLKHAGKAVATVSIGIPYLATLLTTMHAFYFMDLHFSVSHLSHSDVVSCHSAFWFWS